MAVVDLTGPGSAGLSNTMAQPAAPNMRFASTLAAAVMNQIDTRFVTLDLRKGSRIDWRPISLEMTEITKQAWTPMECQRLWRFVAYQEDIGQLDQLLSDSDGEEEEEYAEEQEEAASAGAGERMSAIVRDGIHSFAEAAIDSSLQQASADARAGVPAPSRPCTLLYQSHPAVAEVLSAVPAALLGSLDSYTRSFLPAPQPPMTAMDLFTKDHMGQAVAAALEGRDIVTGLQTGLDPSLKPLQEKLAAASASASGGQAAGGGGAGPLPPTTRAQGSASASAILRLQNALHAAAVKVAQASLQKRWAAAAPAEREPYLQKAALDAEAYKQALRQHSEEYAQMVRLLSLQAGFLATKDKVKQQLDLQKQRQLQQQQGQQDSGSGAGGAAAPFLPSFSTSSSSSSVPAPALTERTAVMQLSTAAAAVSTRPLGIPISLRDIPPTAAAAQQQQVLKGLQEQLSAAGEQQAALASATAGAAGGGVAAAVQLAAATPAPALHTPSLTSSLGPAVGPPQGGNSALGGAVAAPAPALASSYSTAGDVTLN